MLVRKLLHKLVPGIPNVFFAPPRELWGAKCH